MKIIFNIYQLPVTIIITLIAFISMLFTTPQTVVDWLERINQKNYIKHQQRSLIEKILYVVLFNVITITPWVLIIYLIK